MRIKGFVRTLSLLIVVVLISCEKSEDTTRYLIPEKAIGAFRIDFSRILTYNENAVLGTPIETLYLMLTERLSDIGIEQENILEVSGFLLPYKEHVSNTPIAVLFELSGHDPVVFNNFTVRNPKMIEVQYEEYTYWYDETERIAVYAKSDQEIFVANEISAMDELIELAYKQPPLSVNVELVEFLSKNEDKTAVVKSKFPEAITEDLLILHDFQDFSLSVDVGISLEVVLEINTSNADTSEGIAALINGASRIIYGLFKLGLIPFEQLEEEDEDLTPDVKEALITLNEIVGTVKARSRDTHVRITMDPKIGMVVKMLEYWSDLDGCFLSSE